MIEMYIEKNKKDNIRKEMKVKRAALSEYQIRAAAKGCLSQLLSLPEFQDIRWIYPYMSYRSEVDTTVMIPEFIKRGKHVAVPKVRGEEMDFYEISSLEECRPGAYGILEPDEQGKPVEESGWILMPGLAFDKKGNRLGYGGGFYDKYLEKHENLISLALAYPFQVFSSIPREDHDRRVDYLITPEKIWKCHGK